VNEALTTKYRKAVALQQELDALVAEVWEELEASGAALPNFRKLQVAADMRETQPPGMFSVLIAFEWDRLRQQAGGAS